MLTRTQIDDLIRSFFREALEQDQLWRVLDKGEFDWKSDKDISDALTLVNDEKTVESAIEESGKHPRDFVQEHLTRIAHANLKIALQINDWREAELFTTNLLRQRKIELPKDSLEYRLLCHGILRAAVEATRIILERSNGNWAAEAQDPFFRVPEVSVLAPASGESQSAEGATETLSMLVERFLREKKGISEKSALDYRAAVRTFEEVIGANRQPSSIKRSDIVAFKDTLLHTPANWTKRFPGRSIREAIDQNRSAELPTLSAGTINNKYLSPLSTFCRWLVSNDIIEKNPAEGIRVHLPKGHKRIKKRLPFNSDQLNLIFSSPLFTSQASESDILNRGSDQVRDHRFWAPLIALWSGARANEIGQLAVSDVILLDNIWCMSFTEDGGTGDKRLKTAAARRIVPVHPELEQLGFLHYVEQLRRCGEMRLFPKWAKGQDGYYSSILSKWFARFLTSIGLTDRRLVFHSFRHTFKDALRRAMVEERIQDALMGHEPDHISADYGLGYAPRELFEAIRRVQYPGVVLNHLMDGRSQKA
jgi:integrase